MRKDRRRKPTPEHAKARLTCLHLPSEHLSKPLSFFSCQKYIHEECLIWVVYVLPSRRFDIPAPAVGLLFIPTIFPAQTFPREWLLFVVSGMGFLSSTSPANTRSRRVSQLLCGFLKRMTLHSSFRIAWLGRLYETFPDLSIASTSGRS